MSDKCNRVIEYISNSIRDNSDEWLDYYGDAFDFYTRIAWGEAVVNHINWMQEWIAETSFEQPFPEEW